MNKKKKNYSIYVQKILIIAVVAAILATIALYITLTQSGKWLVNDDTFDHVNWVVILDGQSADMERSDFAAKLVAQGKADSILILGRRVYRDRSNAEFYADDFLKHSNIDSSAIFLARHDDASTISEAYTIIPWLKSRKADTVLLLTTAAATKRVSNIFKKLAGESPVFLTTDIHHYLFEANTWYINRESRKNWLREWAARFYSNIELMGIDSLTEADSVYYAPIRSLLEDKNGPVISLNNYQKQGSTKQAASAETPKQAQAEPAETKTAAKKEDSKETSAETSKKESSETAAEPKKSDKKADSKKNDKSDKKTSAKQSSKKDSKKSKK